MSSDGSSPLFHFTKSDSECGQLLIDIIVELTSDALSFFLLGDDQFASEVLDLCVAMPKRVFGPFALSDVDHEAAECCRAAIFVFHTYQIVEPNDRTRRRDHAIFELVLFGHL